LSVYESSIWRVGRSLLPKPLRLKVRTPVLGLIALYKSVVKKSYSANGEDLLVRSLLVERDEVWYLDVGAGDPRIHSNTYGFYLRGAEGVAVDANNNLLAKFKKARPRDTTICGAIATSGGLSNSVTYWMLDPWELSTTDPDAMQRAVANGARIVSTEHFPIVDVNGILESAFPADDRVKLLNVDIEGISYEVLNSIDFSRFSFDYVLVERDAIGDAFERAMAGPHPASYVKVGAAGPTDLYSRLGVGLSSDATS
jgi:hypothetical protein